jgi:aspartyl-tRNA(Asn)/glutamyl-tRNA(Gln) amidotransferase subunit A
MNNKLNKLSLRQARTGLKNRDFSSTELIMSCLDQIERFDKKIHAYLVLNNTALKEAQKADEILARGKAPPLCGIPLAIKDNFLTRGLETTASSNVLKGYLPHYESTVTKKLLESGAIFLGKTNMDAWAHGSSTETSDFGPTLNPWNTGHLPGGSSGGSAAAVAADMCIAAIGSETAGSVRQPAAWCGVSGFKPTYGRVSRYGVIAMASSTDSPGPLVKDIADALDITNIIAGKDPNDATTSSRPVDEVNTVRSDIKGLRIGLAKEYLLAEMRPDVKKLINAAADKFRELGAIVEEISLIDPKYSIGVYTIVQRSEVSSNLARFDGIRYGHDRSRFGDEAKRRIMLGTYALSSGYYDQYYSKAQKVRTLVIRDFQHAFTHIDLILGPTSPGPALKVGASKDQPMFGEMEDILVEPSSIAGLTGASIPCGFVDGLPIGLQIIGPQFGESQVFTAALAYQKITNWHNERPSL